MNPASTALCFSLAFLSCQKCDAEPPAAAKHSCCVKAEAPGTFTDKSIFQTESIWTNDQGAHIKLSALAGRPQVIAMFFANCQSSCPIIVNEMKNIEAALPASLQGSVGFTLISFDSKRDTHQMLMKYRRSRDLSSKNWTLLQGSPNDVLVLANLLGVKFKDNGAGQFIHSNLITILNAKGEIIRQNMGLNQDTQKTIRALRELIGPNRR